MKRYTTIGELLIDFRAINNLTKLDLADKFDVDIRTINRWEKNDTLLKPEKEEEMVDITFIPYQVIRNLNAPVAIPTYYDFDLRKYSVSEFSNELPDMNWLKSMQHITTDRLRTITNKSELELVIRSTMLQADINKPISEKLVFKASKILPELNFIIFDESGYYSGHCIYFPLSRSTYQKIRDKKITEEDIILDDLTDYKTEENPVFYLYDISSDCNETLFYVSAAIGNFFKNKIKGKYTIASYTSRHDTFKINEQTGATLVWEDKDMQAKLGSVAAPRLYEHNRG